MRIAIDFDDTIFDKKKCEPMPHAVEAIKGLSKENEITIFTTRPDYDYPSVKAMLKAWDIPYDRIICGKPSYDVFIDDKATEFKGWK